MPLVKQNVMKFEVFIVGGQRIDRDSVEGEERIEKGSRERIEIERRIRNIDTCPCLLFSFLKALCFS